MITISPYNPQWPDDFTHLAEPLRHALGDLALRIDQPPIRSPFSPKTFLSLTKQMYLMNIEVRILKPDEAQVLTNVAPDVFDAPIITRWAAEFLSDSRHHLAVAMDADLVVGMASAVHYVHPDKAPQLWINEVGVDPTHRNQGIAKQPIALLLAKGKELHCTEAWVLTEQANEPAMRLYASLNGRKNPERPVMFEFDLANNLPPNSIS